MGFGPIGGVAGGAAPKDNWLINSDGVIDVAADGASVADAAYGGPTLWYCLSQTGNITHSAATGVAAGVQSMHRILQLQAGAQRMGIAHPVRSNKVLPCRSTSMTLSGKIRCSASTTIRYAVLEWTGTADAITRDVVNDWTSASYTAGGFFIATTTNVLATGSKAVTANTLTDINATNLTIGASANNLIVMVWTDSTQAQNVTLDSRLKLETGLSASDWAFKDDVGDVREMYQRITYGSQYSSWTGRARSTSVATFSFTFHPMWRAPTVTMPAYGTGSGAVSVLTAADVAIGSGSIAVGGVSTIGCEISISSLSPANLVQGDAVGLSANGFSAVATLDARL